MKKLLSLLLCAALCVSAMTACGSNQADTPATEPTQQTEEKQETEQKPAEEKPADKTQADAQDSHYPLTISTYNYALEPVEYTFEKAPERVITFWSNSLETMLALGLGDRIVCAVGMNEEDVLPELKPELEKMKNTEYYTDFKDSNAAMSKETAIMMDPDFILAWKSSFSDKTIGDVGYWHENGVGTYMALNSNNVSKLRTVENEYQDILTIGKIFDVEDKAQALVDEMKAEVERVTSQTKDMEKKSVLIVEFVKDKIWTYDETYLAGDMVKAMGGNLINTEREIGEENIVELDPDVLIVIGNEEKKQQVMENPAFASLKAVQNGNVTPISLSEVYTSGVRTINGLNGGESKKPKKSIISRSDGAPFRYSCTLTDVCGHHWFNIHSVF